MNIRDIYYDIRPFIPRPIQLALRTQFAAARRRAARKRWPIDCEASVPPISWGGWPENKKFALVLTHDVETAVGHGRCHQVMSMEKAMGLRSAFNFVAERYPVSAALRRYLVDNGFEIGVHGIYHDGKDFKSRRIFERRAPKINRYLKEWHSVGFRAPAMYCRLDWLHELDIEYDASTFDTDPFELGAAAARTIFPFYVNKGPNGNGYVELPYTLPQDFTLFVILREKNLDIWKRKLDWIAEQGGMVLMITHPDYMNFNNDKASMGEYPAGFYGRFLEYIKSKYQGQYWNPLPREIARFWYEKRKAIEERPSTPRRKPLRVCMPVYGFYQTDNRVIRYAETLAKRGDDVEIISLRKPGQSAYEVLNGVRVFRIQERIRNEKGKLDYLVRLAKFFFRSAALLTKRHLKAPYDLIHVHSVPDYEVFAALAPKLTGAKVILDIHDIVPEFYASKFDSGSSGALFKLLLAVEKLSARFSDHVIISNHLWKQTLIERSVSEDKCTVILNYPDPAIFRKCEKSIRNGKKIVMYPGSLNYHQGLDIAIRAFGAISGELPEAEFHIYGEGEQLDNLMNLANGLALEGRVKFFRAVPINEIAGTMVNADLGIVPKRNDSFGNEAFSTKILEFMSLGVPVLVSSTRIDRFYFNDDVVQFFKAQDEDDLAEKLLFLLKNESFRETLAARALDMAREFSWDLKKTKYLDLVDSLTGSIT